jgi:putative hydrolase of the HAD superfamily
MIHLYRKKYKHLFFDIDRTLWDFEANSIEAFRDIIVKYKLDERGVKLEEFNASYHKHNERLWVAYRKGQLKKHVLRSKRFELVLEEFGIDDDVMAHCIGEDYITIAPTKSLLFPFVVETLEYLQQQDYQMHIITNGFDEVQFRKLKNSGLDHFFTRVVTSDTLGVQKPHPKIFEYAVNSANARKKESIMIGDDLELDIRGARNYGIDQVFFNVNHIEHLQKVTFEINRFDELMDIF